MVANASAGPAEAFRSDGPKVPEMTLGQLAEGDRLARECKPKTWAELLAADGASWIRDSA